ncbi:glycosylphosphatidylinositol anchor biosynthesis [Ascosphaera aggregata]|nr:glycosylphosphatidylinositol anchor biosynthesis [Ascosphaera aggregata]
MPSGKPRLRRSVTVEEAVVNSDIERPSTVMSRLIILFLLLAFRMINALSLRTFFQPDEFYQSLEPAWDIAFGPNSGAWITWIIIAAPRLFQGLFAAATDFYTWTFAQRIYGISSYEARAATTLTIAALSLWPWKWPSEVKSVSFQDDRTFVGKQKKEQKLRYDTRFKLFVLFAVPIMSTIHLIIRGVRLAKCFLLAAFACILRPTNIIIWATLSFLVFFKPVRPTQPKNHMLRGTPEERYIFCQAVLYVGLSVLTLSFLADYIYFRELTFPPIKFLHFNLVQSLAVFYGVNDWHYYLTQGFPLLLTTALPFALMGLIRELFATTPPAYKSIKRQLAIISVALPGLLSFISHKEVRFIYPILPCLHILAAPVFVDYFGHVSSIKSPHFLKRLWLLGCFLLVNFIIGRYTTRAHASGVFDVFAFLRAQYLDNYAGRSYPGATAAKQASAYDSAIMTIGFLMPCHSTPWRSHLVFPDIHAWALSCEPPVNLGASEKAKYVDEADQFYGDVQGFLKTYMTGGLDDHLPNRPSYQSQRPAAHDPVHPASDPKQGMIHDWPDYLVFYEQLEPEMDRLLSNSSYKECHRSFNSAWHDDWRRQGDMIVWCLDTDVQKYWNEMKLVKNAHASPIQEAIARTLLEVKHGASPYLRTATFWTYNTVGRWLHSALVVCSEYVWTWIRHPWPFTELQRFSADEIQSRAHSRMKQSFAGFRGRSTEGGRDGTWRHEL